MKISSFLRVSLLGALLSFFVLGAIAQTSETRDLKPFRGIKVGQAISVYLEQGSSHSARIETKGITTDRVVLDNMGGVLRIHVSDGYRKGSVKVFLTFKSLESIQVSSAASVFCNSPIKTNEFDLQVSSAGTAEIKIEAALVRVAASSSGDVELSGKADRLIATASSAGEVNAYGTPVKHGEFKASSAGSIKATVQESIEANASSGGTVRYRGSPGKSNTNSSSGGSVMKSN
jgi:hypothetical protein